MLFLSVPVSSTASIYILLTRGQALPKNEHPNQLAKSGDRRETPWVLAIPADYSAKKLPQISNSLYGVNKLILRKRLIVTGHF